MSRSEYDAAQWMAWHARAQSTPAAAYPSEDQAREMQQAAKPTEAQWRAMQNHVSQAEAARWEAMAAQARQGMAVHEPLSHDDRQTLRRIYAALAIFWLCLIGAAASYFYAATIYFYS